MPEFCKVLLQMTILVAANSAVMGEDGRREIMQPSSNILTLNRGGKSERYYSSANERLPGRLVNERQSSKNERGFNKRASTVSQRIDPTLKYSEEIEGKEGKNIFGMKVTGANEGDDLQADIERLQAHITKTAMEINQLYGSYANAKSGNIAYSKNEDNQLNLADGGKPGEKVFQALCSEKTCKHCSSGSNVMELRDKLRLERSVRNQMIRILAKEKLENERKTKALQALIKYYHPDRKVLRQLQLPSRLKRVIIAEKLKLLPIDQRMEFERRVKNLREKIRTS